MHADIYMDIGIYMDMHIDIAITPFGPLKDIEEWLCNRPLIIIIMKV